MKRLVSDCHLQALLRPRMRDPFVLLEDASSGRSLFFNDIHRVLSFSAGDDHRKFFDSLQRFLDRGFWVCGYLSYEFGYCSEPKLADRIPSSNSPLAWFLVTRKPRILTCEDLPGFSPSSHPTSFEIRNMRANTTRVHYYRALRAIKRHLVRGDTYQVNYTLKLRFDFFGDPVGLYSALRESQSTPYMALVNTGDDIILSLSPELFFKRRGRAITMRPMKGTSAKGRTVREDLELCGELSRDGKSRAENIMIVDLLRNDLGKIADAIAVPDFFSTESHRTLIQMTSTITARLKRRVTLAALFGAIFPSGSVTGAPKLRTMRLIRALEGRERGVYTGAIGYCAPGERACFNVAIRTVRIRKDKGELGVGSGIVYDSRPADEYREVLLKARFLTSCTDRFSLIETIRYENGYYLLDLHLARLAASCRYFAVPYDESITRKALDRFSRTLTGLSRVRLTLDLSGRLSLTSGPLDAIPQRIRIALEPAPVSAENTFLYHKTTNRAWYEDRLRRARRAGFYEVVFRNERGELTEGAFTNLFIRKNNRIYTPPVSCGLLPGVLRQDLLDRGRAAEKKLFPRDLRRADAIYIGNSVRGLCAAEIFLADS